MGGKFLVAKNRTYCPVESRALDMVGRFLAFGARDIGRFLGVFHLCASAGWWQDNMKDIHSYLSVFGDGALRVKTVFAGCGSRESAAEPMKRDIIYFVYTRQRRGDRKKT